MRQFIRSRLGQITALAALAAIGLFAASPLANADGPLPTITTVTASVPNITVPGSGYRIRSS
jgi:multidrug efflux pump subunit AcrA (membrane-fusion protein)